MSNELALIEGFNMMAQQACKSGFFPMLRKPEQAFVQIMTGHELGIGPMTALQQIAVVNGKPVLGSALMAAKIKQHPKYDYRKPASKKLNEEATCIILQKVGDTFEEVGSETFSIKDAERAGLLGKNNWKNYPQAMLWARALTQAARMHCPDVFMGSVYSPDEMNIECDRDGEMLEAQVIDVKTTEPAQAEGKYRTDIPDEPADVFDSKEPSLDELKGELNGILISKGMKDRKDRAEWFGRNYDDDAKVITVDDISKLIDTANASEVK